MASKACGFGGLGLDLEVEVEAEVDERKDENNCPSLAAEEDDKGPSLTAKEEGKEGDKVGEKFLALSSR